MKTLSLILISGLLAAGTAFGQLNTMYSTTLSAAVSATGSVINVTSATNMTAPAPQSTTPSGSELYIVAPGNPRGEAMLIASISGTAITVKSRGMNGVRSGFPNGSLVLFGPPNWFRNYDPSGSCVTANIYITPHVNTLTGMQHLCSTITLSWVPGWQNPNPPAVTAAVASVAGATAINGPLQHITGTNAITSFTMGTGWNGGGFCVIPDGAFTTTATNNIAKASTAVVNRPLCYTWDATNSLFTPSY